MTTSESREGEGSDALALLPFKVTKIVQYGRRDPRFELVLGDGVTIRVKNARMLLSWKKMRIALFNAGYFLHSSTAKRWDEIVQAILDLKVVEDDEEARR